MANANWNNPTNTTLYSDVLLNLRDRDEDLARQFDGTTSTNLVNNTIKWDASAKRWKKWSTSTSGWVELTTLYDFTAIKGTNLEISHSGSLTYGILVGDEANLASSTGIYLRSTTQATVAWGAGGVLSFATSGGTVERARFDAAGQFHTRDVSGTVRAAYAARAYVNFNGSGTVSIRSSGNVSSITDNGTGNYTVNFTTAMSDTNYAVGGSVTGNADPNSISMAWTTSVSGGQFVKTTSSVRVVAMRTTNNDIRDAVDCSVLIYR